MRPESRLSDILSFRGGGHGSSNSLSRLSMDESSRLSPPAIQHHNMLLYDHTNEKMVEAMLIYFPSWWYSEVSFMFGEKLYETQSGCRSISACPLNVIIR